MQFYKNCANQKKVVAPSAQKWKVAPGGTVLPPGGPCSAQSTKNSVFREPEHPSHLWYGAWSNQCAARRFLLFQEPQPSSLHLRALTNPQLLCFPLIFQFKGYTDRFKIMVRSYGSHYMKTRYIISFNSIFVQFDHHSHVIQLCMMPKHSKPIRTSHFLNQNHSSTRKNIKIKLTGSRRLAGVHHRQAVHHKTQKLGCRFVAPGGTEIHRQAVSQGTQKHTKLACVAWRLWATR